MKCNICKIKDADKKKSHIVPKFLGKGLYGEKGNIRGFKLKTEDLNKKPEIVQDIPKEDYIFCSECEAKLSILETYFANRIYSPLFIPGSKQIFKVKKLIRFSTKTTKEVDGDIINLLIQSILWRQHISNHSSFSNFYIDKAAAEIIRNQLNQILALKKVDLLQNMEIYRSKYKFLPYLIWTHTKVKKDDNFLFEVPSDKFPHLLVLNSIRIKIGTDKNQFLNKKKWLNENKETFTIMLRGIEYWTHESKSLFEYIVKYSKQHK